MSNTTATEPGRVQRPGFLEISRAILLVLAVVAYALWGFLDWPLPLPGVIIGVGAPVLVIVLWALFVSPRSVIATDLWGQSLVELLIIAGAVFALIWLELPIVGVVYGVIAVVVGFFSASRRLPPE